MLLEKKLREYTLFAYFITNNNNKKKVELKNFLARNLSYYNYNTSKIIKQE